MAYRVGTETHGERTVLTLHDDVSGSSASILPSYGFNLFDLRLPLAGTPRPVLATQPGWAEAPRDAARNGVPILFPYPNRVRDGQFRFRGKDYRLPITLKPNAIHGFALDVPWDVVEHKATPTEAYATGRYQISKHSPDMRGNWPSDAVLQVRYGLSGHIGRLGEYAERAAAAGVVLIATVNNGGAGQRVAPPGGLEPRIGTNPLCAAVPTSTDPVVLDFGTSAAAEGKVRVYYINDKAPVPQGWLQDSEGRPTTDPSVLYEPPFGTILPMGGIQAYKGFGLGLVLDMLAGGLSGGATCHPNAPPPRGNSVLFMALDAAQFAGLDALIHQSECVADYVRGTPRAPGVEAILLPGDPELRTLERRSAHGIPLEEAHWLRLAELAQRLGVPLPEFVPEETGA